MNDLKEIIIKSERLNIITISFLILFVSGMMGVFFYMEYKHKAPFNKLAIVAMSSFLRPTHCLQTILYP